MLLEPRACCRSRQRAEELASSLSLEAEAEVADLEDIASGDVDGDVLVNTTSIGMQPNTDSTPVPSSALGAYRLVFDAVYTPVETKLLRVSHHHARHAVRQHSHRCEAYYVFSWCRKHSQQAV